MTEYLAGDKLIRERGMTDQAATRARGLRLQAHVEGVLIKPSTAKFSSFAEIASQLREIIADDVTDDEIIMAAHRVRQQWRQWPHPQLVVIEANYRWLLAARGHGTGSR